MPATNTFSVQQPDTIKAKVLNWLKQFSTFCFLDSNGYDCRYSHYQMLAGVGIARHFTASGINTLPQLQRFINQKKSWLFGHLSYELPTTERLYATEHTDKLLFADATFFEPQIVLQLNGDTITIIADDPDATFDTIIASPTTGTYDNIPRINVSSSIDRQEYMNIIDRLQQHIHRGDCYEINYCFDFFAENVTTNPFVLYQLLNTVSPNPFAALYRTDEKWLLCASPERFLQKKGSKLISQPIKGTLPRNAASGSALSAEQQSLLNSDKEKAENVMVVDLVRNDLSRVCRHGSVQVEELFGIYSYPQVHQMISTVSGILPDDADFEKIINATFPMGSMTGAPKIRVMQLIEEYEKKKRGIFSGTVGYITPEGDFDLNVVIRSIMYNQSTQYLSYMAGSGITVYANAEKEWEECLLKAAAIRKILL